MARDFVSGDWLGGDTSLNFAGGSLSAHVWCDTRRGGFLSGPFEGAFNRPWLFSGGAAGPSLQVQRGTGILTSTKPAGYGWRPMGVSFLHGVRIRTHLIDEMKEVAAALGITDNATFELGRAASAVYSDCALAHYAIWDVELTPLEFAALNRGAPPPTIRPGSLRAYWPLSTPGTVERDASRYAKHLTVNGSPEVVPSPSLAGRMILSYALHKRFHAAQWLLGEVPARV